MKYTAELSSGVMIYLPGFVKIGSGKQKLMGVGDSQRDRQKA
jgi:hypothetical protein